MKASIIIVAAGSGTRLGFETPKAFVKINGASLLRRVLRTVSNVEDVSEIVAAVPRGEEHLARAEADAAGLQIPLKITEGGTERQDSVRLALLLTSAEADLVAIHDAARPFATPAMFSACLAGAKLTGAAIVAVPVADTLKRVEAETIVSTVARQSLWHAQTPQAFRRELLIRAHDWALRDGIRATDDANLLERQGVRVQVVPGSPFNLKITTPEDLRMSEAIAQSLFPR
jgi:2-C-methyl-D-erythritol 4-phosphate cytidylyltransferase